MTDAAGADKLRAVSDGAQVAAWVALLATGIVVCVALARAGVPRTNIRDLLHLGAGSWVLGWPAWRDGRVPIAIPVLATLLLAALPAAAKTYRPFNKFVDAVSSQDERFAGLVLYAGAFAAFTALAFVTGPFPAAAALWCLSFGDGLGGAVGLRFGRHRFTALGKTKSWEGTGTMFVVSAAAISGASAYFGAPISWPLTLGCAAIAAAVEAGAPRASDNLLVPAAVWCVLMVAR